MSFELIIVKHESGHCEVFNHISDAIHHLQDASPEIGRTKIFVLKLGPINEIRGGQLTMRYAIIYTNNQVTKQAQVIGNQTQLLSLAVRLEALGLAPHITPLSQVDAHLSLRSIRGLIN